MVSGMIITELLEDYPDLEQEDSLGCIPYAINLVQSKQFDIVAY